MDINDAVITCSIEIQWQSAASIGLSTGRKLFYRTATLRLIRNDIREIFIEISPEKLNKPIKFRLKDITVHKKFMTEGKASINLNSEKCILFLSNAPPGTLITFLKIMFFKITGNNENNKLDEKTMLQKCRAHLLSGNPTKFEEISPVTNTEMILAKKMAGLIPSRSTITTPSPSQIKKRKLSEINSHNQNVKEPVAKKKLSEKFTSSSGELSTSSTASTSGLRRPPANVSEENIKLCEEQGEVLKACLSGKNVFFTGSAGTGKSFLLKKIISSFPPDGTVVTASTGIAASLIGGVTLHFFAGIGSGDATIERCLEMASRSAQNWRKCKRLIIDEISMVDCQFFEKIEKVARHIRRNDKPFGGIQLIICGDFFQLPPVVKGKDISSKRFAFQSPAWEQCTQVVFELKEVHRQSDKEFVKILSHIRIGHVTEEISNRLLETSAQQIEENGILATQLCSHTNDANAINDMKLNNLPGEEKIFKAEDSDVAMTKQLDSQLQAPSQLVLKEGAQVILLKNINVSNALVNGARGIILRFEKGLPLVRFKNKLEYLCKIEKWTIKTPTGGMITRKQIPLKLGWAFSIHKSQGLTLDCVEMSLSKVFEAGQAYVALSRARSLNSVRILDFDGKQVWANPQVLSFYRNLRRRLQPSIIPLGGNMKTKSSNDLKNENRKIAFRKTKSLMEKPLVTIC